MIEIKVACRVDLNMIEKFYNENQLNLKNEFNKSATYVIVLESKEIIGASQVLYEKYILQDVQLLSRDYYKIPVVEMLFIISKERKD
ncbi:MAG: hypothetical protein LR001_02360 [Clostridiales bacterium]|nr:hypothetical protein [Clostridiales bacterium]